MRGPQTRQPPRRRRRRWLALAAVPLLSGCLGAAMIPILASGPLLGKQKVRAATEVPRTARKPSRKVAPKDSAAAKGTGPEIVVTSLKALPPPSGSPTQGDPWQRFFAFALTTPQTAGTPSEGRSVLLVANPPLEAPARRDCPAQVPAVVIDLDDGSTPFDPQHVPRAPDPVAAGLAKLRNSGIVVLWISELPASRAAEVSRALRTSGLDPKGEDQLLLVRGRNDRKQLLREDANEDVCIVAMAGDRRSDFDELFDYLRHPEQALGLDAMLDKGWFIVPPLEGAAAPAGDQPASTER